MSKRRVLDESVNQLFEERVTDSVGAISTLEIVSQFVENTLPLFGHIMFPIHAIVC